MQKYAFFLRIAKKRAANLSIAALFMSLNNDFASFSASLLCLLNFSNDGLESLGVVQGEVGEHLAVDLDTSLGEFTHQN